MASKEEGHLPGMNDLNLPVSVSIKSMFSMQPLQLSHGIRQLYAALQQQTTRYTYLANV